jgi:hypothetical protein
MHMVDDDLCIDHFEGACKVQIEAYVDRVAVAQHQVSRGCCIDCDWALCNMQSTMCNSTVMTMKTHQSRQCLVGLPCSLYGSSSRLELHIIAIALPTLHLLQPIHLFNVSNQVCNWIPEGLRRLT